MEEITEPKPEETQTPDVKSRRVESRDRDHAVLRDGDHVALREVPTPTAAEPPPAEGEARLGRPTPPVPPVAPPSVPKEVEEPPPQEISPPPPPKIPSPLAPPTPKRRRPIVLGLVLLLVIVLAGLAAAFVAVAYQGIELPLISKELSFRLQKTYAQLPFVPKAARHTLLRSLDSSLEIETFSFDASMSMEKFDLALYGDAEVKEDTANFDLHFAAKSSEPAFLFTLETDLRALDKILYFKVGTLSSPLISTFIDPSPAIGKWWRLDLTTLKTQAREELEKEQEAETYTQQVQQKAIEVFSQAGIINAVTKEQDEKIGEEVSHHLRLIPTKEVVIKLVEALQEKPLTDQEKEEIEESFEMIEKFEIDLWIGKNTLIARKIKVLFKIKPPAEELSPATLLELPGTFEGAFVLEIPKINAPVSITAPEGAQDVEKLIELLMGTESELPDALGEHTKLLLERR